MQDGMKMGSTESGYQGRDRSGMQGNGAYGEVGREEYGEGGREEYRGRGREQYGYHEIKSMREGISLLIFTPALFRLISGRFLFTGMRIWRLLR